MIRKISEWIDSKLTEAGWVEKYFPFVELISNGEFQYPAMYKGAGQYEDVANFDNYNGMAYLRLTGDPSASPSENPMVACSQEMDMIYPVRLVFCVPRVKLKLDDAFAEDALVNDLIKLISTQGGTLKKNLKAGNASIFPESWSTNSIELVGQEYPGRELIDINYEFIYGAINFRVSVQIKKDCIPNSCEEVCYAN